MPKKIFAIYDLNIMPYSIGDIITFIAFVQIAGYRNNTDKYDMCFIANHTGNGDNIFNKLIDKNNRLHYYMKLIDCLQINDSIESIYFCNDYTEFYKLYQSKISDSIPWPPLSVVQSQTYLHYIIYDGIKNFYNATNLLPPVFNSMNLTKWAYDYFVSCTDNLFPVTINIRNNKLFSQHRNSHIDSWINFFSYCSGKYPVKFIIICAKSEIDERFYECANAIVSKNDNLTISQEIALVASSLFHMGAASGPATIAPFVDHPSILVNADLLPYIDKYNGSLVYFRDNRHVRLSFSKTLQYYSTFPETTEYLIQEFTTLLKAVDMNDWKHKCNYWQNCAEKMPYSWLD
jgi:hypothetical protein